ncbi:MAG: type IX secretion system membrane protein PorP/SprF [Flavobacteriaceae bacterium]|nr:type IX secretion system membrane protein PorP/SprF [Flavobacteriaceae bacterium]
MKSKGQFILLGLGLMMIFGSQKVQAQFEPNYSQYMYQTAGINAAYVGSTTSTEISALYRKQWAKVDGAPTTMVLGVNHPIAKKNMGIGLTLINDVVGPVKHTLIKAQYAYRIQLEKDMQLSFGMDAGGLSLNVNFDQNDLLQPEDGSIDQNTFNKFYLQLGAGAYLYTKNWYAGVSIPNILGSSIYNEEVQSLIPDSRQFNFIGGYVYEINKDLKFKPAALFHFVPSAQSHFSLSTNFLYREKFTLGASYRFGTAFSALAGFAPNKNWFIGYAYDFFTSDFGRQTGGSHEVILKYQFGKKKVRQIQTPRFF